MKDNIHPECKKVTAICSCGNEIDMITTAKGKEQIRLDVCSRCHPFYTGKQKLVDTAGRINKFKKKYFGDDGASAA